MISKNIFQLLIAVYNNRADETLQQVFFDALEEEGLIRIKHIFQGLCPECGGILKQFVDKADKDDAYPMRYMRCKKCGSDDIFYSPLDGYRFNRIIRELGCSWCRYCNNRTGETWGVSKPLPNCKKCNGIGIIVNATNKFT